MSHYSNNAQFPVLSTERRPEQPGHSPSGAASPHSWVWLFPLTTTPMSHHDLAGLISEAVDAVCPDGDHPFEERTVALWVLQHPAVSKQRGSPEYEDIETRVRTEVPAQLRARIDEMGARVYLAGHGPNGRHMWYPMRVIHDRANGDDTLLHKLIVALQRQDAAYQAGARDLREER